MPEKRQTGSVDVNADFPRIITLLRKERGISQKQAANDLDVSQALLSHYEKGIRECGLDFLVKISDYYNVSCDYLLGRSPEPAGKTLSYDDIPDADAITQAQSSEGSITGFNKKIIVNSVNLLFSLVSKAGSTTLCREISNYLMLAVYRMFRIVYSSHSGNDKRFFTIPEVCSQGLTASAMAASEAAVSASAGGISIGGGDCVKAADAIAITTSSLSDEYPGYAPSLLNLIKSSEVKINSGISAKDRTAD